MASDDFEKDEYKNWVRGAKGLEYLQEGLHEFVGDKVRERRDNVLQQIVCKLPAGRPKHCSQCTSQNLLPDHWQPGYRNRRNTCNRNTCIQRSPFNCFGNKPDNRRKCPNDICSKFYDQIVRDHSYADPAWKNTDPTTWCLDQLGWSYGKCFQTSVNEGTSAHTTDAAGLLSILINNKEIQWWLACRNMASKVGCPFNTARDIRNVILHSSKLEIKEPALCDFLKTFMAVLQDGKYLSSYSRSKDAFDKLMQLKSMKIYISKGDAEKLVQMRIEALSELDERKDESLREIDYKLEDSISAIKNTVSKETNSALKHIDMRGKKVLQVIEEAKDRALSDMAKAEHEKFMQNVFIITVKNVVSEEKDSALQNIEKSKANVIQVVEESRDTALTDILKTTPTEVNGMREALSDFKENNLKLKMNTASPGIEELMQEVRQLFDKGKETLSANIEIAISDAVEQIKQRHIKAVSQNEAEISSPRKELRASSAISDQTTNIGSIETQSAEEEHYIQQRTNQTTNIVSIETQSAEEEQYIQQRTKLKDDLISLYRQQYHTLPLSPLIEAPFLEYYVMPGIRKKEIQRSLGGVKYIKSKLTTLHQVFYKGEMQCREIYLVADAGSGKTAFSKKLVLTWCQAHKDKERDKEHFKKPDIDAMSEFEFVFLVSLRDCPGECDIVNMITVEIVSRLANRSEIVETVLMKEKCLVILDGLDEWTHPTSRCALKPRDIPHRKASKRCTILTTTRRWRLSVINLSASEIEQELELDFRNEMSIYKFKKRVISHLTGEKGETLKRHIRDFDSAVVDKGISDLGSNPLLLLYLLYLWHDNRDLGRSKCEIYCQILEMLLKRAFMKHLKVQSIHISSLREIPACFAEYENCKSHCVFLTHLGELAFQTLFSERSENRLVFDSYIAEKCLGEDGLELGRLTGIITQDKQRKLTSQIRKTSFAHKTMQEFFAALYISTCSDQDKVLTKFLSYCLSIQHILDLSKVLIFISGINSDLFSLLSYELMEVINKDEITSEYRSTSEFVFKQPLGEIQDMFVACIKEIPDNKSVHICLQDFFFDRKCKQENYLSLQRLALQNKTNIRSIHIDIELSQSVSEIIDSCELEDPRIQCETMYCGKGHTERDIICLLSTSVKRLHVECLQVDVLSCLTDEQCKTFHNSSQLETIYIWNSAVGHKLMNYILNVKSVKVIVLHMLSCSDNESSRSDNKSSSSDNGDLCTGFNFDLSRHPDIQELVLRFGNFTLCDTSEDKGSLLQNMRNIKHVQLWKVKVSSMLLRCLVEIIEQLVHSVKVELASCEITPREEYEDIRDYIRRSESFFVMRDDRDWFEFVTHK